MALKLNERYPGRFNNPTSDYPQGSFKNRTAPNAKDGSYLEQDWANDKEGFFQSLIQMAGLSPNGLVDKVGSSQFYDALLSVISQRSSGRFIGVQRFATPGTFTYTPTPGTSSVVVEVQGGGGAGGGCGAAAAGQISIATGGNAGAYAKSRITTGFSGASIVVGGGGSGRTGLSGLSGGASSFGVLVTAPGGVGGALYAGTAIQTVVNINFAGQTIASGGNIINASGGQGAPAIASQVSGGSSGNGGDSLFGAGAIGAPVISGSFFNGNSSACVGAAGSGAASTNGTGAAGGGTGAAGIVIVWEYA